ncbi:MAG: hypothetical protein JXB32_10925 [Deltaproteobacteria bacterium]|nr:hypothetical protein [Deltaproteobacteria bacterium]
MPIIRFEAVPKACSAGPWRLWAGRHEVPVADTREFILANSTVPHAVDDAGDGEGAGAVSDVLDANNGGDADQDAQPSMP